MTRRVAACGLVLLTVCAIPQSTSVSAAPVQKRYAIVGGAAHTCQLVVAFPGPAITPSSSLACWGANADGQLGDGTFIERHQPVKVKGLPSPAASVTAGAAHTCVVAYSGGVYCWGRNDHGQLGDGTTTDSAVPLLVPLPSPAIRVAAGHYFTCAVLSSHTLYCWGHNEYGQAGGDQLNLLTPGLRFKINTVEDVAGGFGHGCIRLMDDTVQCWGLNDTAQLGDHTLGGVVTSLVDPIDEDLSAGVSRLSLGNRSSCAQLLDGVVKCWGSQADANGTHHVYRLGAGTDHACIARNARATRVYCWGDNNQGQLGNGSFVDSATLVAVQGIGAVAALGSGHFHTCAITAAGARWCWGDNSAGQLGDGTTLDSNVPVH